jgi:hypothetical protein
MLNNNFLKAAQYYSVISLIKASDYLKNGYFPLFRRHAGAVFYFCCKSKKI